MPKLRHYDHLNTARFVIFCCYRRHKFLTTPVVVEEFLKVLRFIRNTHSIKILGYVIMPEHVHLVLNPPNSLRLGPVIGRLKSHSASAVITKQLLTLPTDCRIVRNGSPRWAFWQPRCYDHNCRTPETVIEKLNYCHNNPVTRGLVTEPGQWRWSSNNWYAGDKDVPLTIDEIEH